jgi:hypothetical protein
MTRHLPQVTCITMKTTIQISHTSKLYKLSKLHYEVLLYHYQLLFIVYINTILTLSILRSKSSLAKFNTSSIMSSSLATMQIVTSIQVIICTYLNPLLLFHLLSILLLLHERLELDIELSPQMDSVLFHLISNLVKLF